MPSKSSQLYVEPSLPPWWDWSIIGLTAISLVIAAVDMSLPPLSARAIMLDWIDAGLCAGFLLDFAIRMAKAERRWAFFKRNWIDLLGAIPLAGPLHTFRIVRVLRILRFTRVPILARRVMRRFDLAMPTQTLG